MTFTAPDGFFVKRRHAEIPVDGFQIAKAVTVKTMRGAKSRVSHECSQIPSGAI
jgi:hypothetical protein